MKKNKNFRNLIKWIIYFLHVVASCVGALLVYKLNVIPDKYLLVVLLVLLTWNLILFVALNVRNKKKQKYSVREIIAIFLCLLMSIVFVIGSNYLMKTDNTISVLTGADTQIHNYAVYVLESSKAQNIEDLNNENIGMNKSIDQSNIKKVVAKIKKSAADIDTVEFKDFEKLINALYNKEVKSVLLNKAHLGLIEEKYPNFSKETRIIWDYKLSEKVNAVGKKVNVTEDTFSVFLSGIDTEGVVSTVSRSDVNMVVTINPKSKEILMTSIPRDYYVTLADLGQKDKLTHAGLTGIENSVKTVEKFLDININYYAKVNFTTIKEIVNALGGVTINSPYAFNTSTGPIFVGENYLDGQMALSFVRERYNLPNGDNDRIHNQQLLLKAMIEKAISPAIIYNYDSVLQAIEGCFETNMQSLDITRLIKMQLNDGGSWTISQQQLKGEGKLMTGGAYMPNNNVYYMIPDEASIHSCAEAIRAMSK